MAKLLADFTSRSSWRRSLRVPNCQQEVRSLYTLILSTPISKTFHDVNAKPPFLPSFKKDEPNLDFLTKKPGTTSPASRGLTLVQPPCWTTSRTSCGSWSTWRRGWTWSRTSPRQKCQSYKEMLQTSRKLVFQVTLTGSLCKTRGILLSHFTTIGHYNYYC